MFKKRKYTILTVLVIGVVSGILLASRLDICSRSNAEVEKQAVSSNLEVFENAFVEVVDRVKPAVVNITTEHIEKYRDFWSPFGEDPFDDLFRYFFTKWEAIISL